MEFMNRGTQSQSAARPAAPGGAPAAPSGSKSKGWKSSPKWLRIVWVGLLFAGTILVASLLVLMYVGNNSKEADSVDTGKNQAVFLTNGQVYFGKVKAVNRQYIDLRGIYYLNVNQQVQPNQKDTQTTQNSSITLVKLGCELHGPVDQMLINREQVTFWENLKDDGQVSKAIGEWVKQNPNGQTCTQPSTSTDDATKP